MWESDIPALQQVIVRGDQIDSVELTGQLFAAGDNPQEILSKGMIEGMAEVGERFTYGEYFVPEILHDIGKNLAAMFLEGAGFCVIDLGVDVPRLAQKESLWFSRTYGAGQSEAC